MNKTVIYQIMTRLFCNDSRMSVKNGSIEQNGSGKFNRITDHVIDTIRDLGVTHIWLTGIIAHASCTDYSKFEISVSNRSTVKGIAGSPYAIRDYYDVDPDLAENVPLRMQEFLALKDRIHTHGLKLIIDFVPNHVARQYHSVNRPVKVADLGENDDTEKRFNQQNNFYYIPGRRLAGQIDWGTYVEQPAKATGNDRFDAAPAIYDWYETVKLNYGVDYEDNGSKHFYPIPDTWKKMSAILNYWAELGVDGFRCDMAEMVPVEFWNWALGRLKKRFKKIIFIAEIYNPGSYSSYLDCGHFDYIYDKVGLYDTLRSVTIGYESATAITRCWQNAGFNGNRMLHFMENHDEQRIASDFFAGSGIKGRAAMVVSACIDTCPVMVYAGQELGERGMDEEGFSGSDGRTTIFDYWNVDTLKRWYNNGELNDRLLNEDEIKLKDFYRKLLNICRNEKAISSGKFFDLMYVNPVSQVFNAHKQYAFLRSEGDNILLIVANFDTHEAQNKIFIPAHAFDYMGIEVHGKRKARELLSDSEQVVVLEPDSAVNVYVPANGAIILKM